MPIEDLKDLEELVKKGTILLPKPLDLEGIEKLLQYIAQKLPGNIHYQVHYFESLIHRDNNEIIEDRGTVKVNADIHSLKDPDAFDYFKFESTGEDTSKITTFSFSLVPGCDVSDYRPEVLKLWDDVKELVSQYLDSI